MRFPSNKTLGTIAVYGAFASITGVMYMRYKIEDRIRNSEYFRLAIQTLRQHRGMCTGLNRTYMYISIGLYIGNIKRK